MKKKIIIQQLELRNYKKTKHFLFTPNTDLTNVFGDNETGKTTLAESFTWLLFGKDLQDRKDYEIKTLDSENNPIHKLEHEVNCKLLIDGIPTTLKRVYQEKWQTKRGFEVEELTGHETSVWYNDVPLKISEYTAKISLLFPETTFKILTNPLFFNTTFKWEDRRSILIDLIGGVSDEDILSQKKFSSLLDKLTGKTVKEYKAQLSSKKKVIKDEMDGIPSRLDELDRIIPTLEPNVEALTERNLVIDDEIKTLTDSIIDDSKRFENYQNVRSAWLANKGELASKIYDIEQDANSKSQDSINQHSTKVFTLKREIQNLENNINLKNSALENKKSKLRDLTVLKQSKLNIFAEIQKNTITIDDNEFKCPTCQRPYDAVKKHEMEILMLANFDKTQNEKLDNIVKEGQKLNTDIATLTTEIENDSKSLELQNEELEALKQRFVVLESEKPEQLSVKDILADNLEYLDYVNRLQVLTENEPVRPDENTEIKSLEKQRDNLSDEKSRNLTEISKATQIQGHKNRRLQLQNREKELSREYALLQKDEMLIEDFTRAKVDEVANRVNSLFPTVRFKLFEDQLNGGLKECCETLINGVPYLAANSAAQVQAGIEIINALQNKYGLVLPIFNDNAESTTKIPYTESQVIRLFVDKNYETLTVK